MKLLLKNLLFTLVIPGSVAVYVPLWIAWDRAPASGAPRVLAAALFALGGALYAWTVWDFAAFGRGTPAPIDAPRRLVVRGLYRYTRNPMYVGILTVLVGQVALFASTALALYAIAVLAGFHAWIVAYEEPRLAAAFDSQYAAYCRQVPRWLPRPRGLYSRADRST